MKRKTLLATGIAAAVVLALGGGYAYSAATNRPLVGIATAGTAPLSVTASASGSLVSARTVGVYPPTAGTLASVAVSDGDQVKAGAALASMDTGPLKLAVAQARAANSAALAQLDSVNNGVPSAIDRSAAKAALSAARSQVDAATKNYAAYLRDYQQAPPDQKPAMRPTLRTLKSGKAAANAALKAAQAGQSKLSRAARVSTARTAAQQAVSATAKVLDRTKRDLDRAELTAPFAGTVSFNGTVEKGAGLTPGVAVFSIVDPNRMEFEAAVSETDIAEVTVGQPAKVSLDAFGEAFAGKVLQVQPTAKTSSTATVSYPVRISMDAGSARLFAGMSGSADIEVKSIADALTVPIEAVLTKGTAKSVFVLGGDEVVHSRQVTIGASTDTSAQVLTGLSVGDRVVTTGASSLSDGQQVRTR